jgi:type II secretory pathway predicted ATPase ExeA
LSEHSNKRQKSTSVVTTTETEVAREPQDLEVLTAEEEKVLRMLHGMSEEDSHELKFALGADEELRHRLTLLEHYLMELFKGDVLNEELMAQVHQLKDQLTT